MIRHYGKYGESLKKGIMFNRIYEGKRVLVTGHTGFKGSWLCLWLLQLGANVCGYSANVPTKPANFEVLELEKRLEHVQGDIRDRHKLQQVINTFKPEFVFHLAAQPLVKSSFDKPAITFETNTLGTLNVLECLRHESSIKSAVFITSDKCYQNLEWTWGYRENDTLGGEDPYSASKACAELVIYSYSRSFFRDGPYIASARAGNVIGGGDWAKDRIIPDIARAWSTGTSLYIRNPNATRPWQHVLEPLSGYLRLGAKLYQEEANVIGQAFNFGPDFRINQSVQDLLLAFSKHWNDMNWKVEMDANNKESELLKLSCDKALKFLGWRSVLSFDETITLTAQWYQKFYMQTDPNTMIDISMSQIDTYYQQARSEGLEWTV